MSIALCGQGRNHRQDELERAVIEYLGQFTDTDLVRALLEDQGQEKDTRADSELARVTQRLEEMEQGFLNDLDRVDRGIMTEPEYLKRQDVRRQEQEGL